MQKHACTLHPGRRAASILSRWDCCIFTHAGAHLAASTSLAQQQLELGVMPQRRAVDQPDIASLCAAAAAERHRAGALPIEQRQYKLLRLLVQGWEGHDAGGALQLHLQADDGCLLIWWLVLLLLLSSCGIVLHGQSEGKVAQRICGHAVQGGVHPSWLLLSLVLLLLLLLDAQWQAGQ